MELPILHTGPMGASDIRKGAAVTGRFSRRETRDWLSHALGHVQRR